MSFALILIINFLAAIMVWVIVIVSTVGSIGKFLTLLIKLWLFNQWAPKCVFGKHL